jgi:hypothetical protein
MGELRSEVVGRLWKVSLQPQFGAEGVPVPDETSDEERRSQCFLEKTGTSEKAQYRWSFILALVGPVSGLERG